MTRGKEGFIYAGRVEELETKGMSVIHGGACPILVAWREGRIHALDNRCPHLGFPLHRGTVKDGILTCHWHHARFDLASGNTFDLWADDVPTCAVHVEDGEVWVAAKPSYPEEATAHWTRRLDEGMAHNISLVIGKAILGAQTAGVDSFELVRQAALFGAYGRDGWSQGLTILTAMANLLPALPEEEAYLALFTGIRKVADDCEDEVPRRERKPLGGDVDLPTLKRWLRHWTLVRHRNGAERTLLTAIERGATPAQLADLLLTAVTDRYYADTGHALDFINKAFECLDIIGWEYAAEIIPSVVGGMVQARGGEEMTAWRHPVNLVPVLEEVFVDLPGIFESGRARAGEFDAHAALAQELLGEDPAEIIDALNRAILAGANTTDLSRSLAYAAALRVARFGSANEFSDWNTALHSFTYANALHQILKRSVGENGFSESIRGVFHGAMALWLSRFLNIPPARLPGERGETLDDLPESIEDLKNALLDAFDRQGQVESSGRLVTRYFGLGHPGAPLIASLSHALLREDAGFHSYQMFEAGVRQYEEWGETQEGQNILIAAARYLAAHSPTERAAYQTATIARRLQRGGRFYEEEGMPPSL